MSCVAVNLLNLILESLSHSKHFCVHVVCNDCVCVPSFREQVEKLRHHLGNMPSPEEYLSLKNGVSLQVVIVKRA